MTRTTAEVSSELIDVCLTGIRLAARDTHIFEFQKLDHSALPRVEPGAHIDIHLPNGIVRQYSLLQAGPGLASYAIGVKRDPKSRGGSAFMFEQLRVGTEMKIGH